MKHIFLFVLLLSLIYVCPLSGQSGTEGFYLDSALHNGHLANEGFRRCHHYVEGWLALSDPQTGLIPRNEKDLYWNAKDAAADNYPFMVLTTAFTDRTLFEGRMKDMLETEIRLTSRLGAMPDTYDFSLQGFPGKEPDTTKILFGASEYVKDGLLPLTEWLGPSPWSIRMISILDDIWRVAPVDTPFGKIPSTNPELNGEMLQALSRIYRVTGDDTYLEWALRLGDYYLLGDHHPTRDTRNLRLRDHGCEIVSGLCELYATVHFDLPEKKQDYEKPIHQMLDRILEVGRNEHGMFYNAIDPVAGRIMDSALTDTWGYTYNGFYTVYLMDGTERYRQATVKVLSHLRDYYRNFQWEGSSSDGYADAIESALNLYNREPVASAAQWIDSETGVMWNMQRPDGVIEGWHGDGNFARTTIMYCLWKTQGTHVHPWREDLVLGAVLKTDTLYLSLSAEKEWKGKIHFDLPRHATYMNLPMDWPRINQFPEWFTIKPDDTYAVRRIPCGETEILNGTDLQDGLPVNLKAGELKSLRITVR